MITTKWLLENCYKSRCYRCGELFWVRKGCKSDFCAKCICEMEEKNVRCRKK